MHQAKFSSSMLDIEEATELSSYTISSSTSTDTDSSFHSHVINHATLITEHDKKSQNLTMFYDPVSTKSLFAICNFLFDSVWIWFLIHFFPFLHYSHSTTGNGFHYGHVSLLRETWFDHSPTMTLIDINNHWFSYVAAKIHHRHARSTSFWPHQSTWKTSVGKSSRRTRLCWWCKCYQLFHVPWAVTGIQSWDKSLHALTGNSTFFSLIFPYQIYSSNNSHSSSLCLSSYGQSF